MLFAEAKTQWETLKKDLLNNPQPSTSQKTPKKRSKKETGPDTSSVPATPLVSVTNIDPSHKDNSLRQFRKICMALSNESSYLQKTNILKEFFNKGSDGSK